MKDKYIELLLKRCLKLNNSSVLFINYDKVIKKFVKKIVLKAEEMGIKDIYLDEIDTLEVHDFLTTASIDAIKKSKMFDNSIWDKYAKKKAAFLMLESEIPHLMDDIDDEKIGLVAKIRRETKPVYREMQLKGEIPWCIAAVPNEEWAKKIFSESDKPLDTFWNVLAKLCLFDTNDPSKSWDKFLETLSERQKKLNALKIRKLHYRNSLGTDLEVTLPEGVIWQSIASDKWIVNIPSYEIFTSPDYRKTQGVVYSSRPLIYNGKVIDGFKVEFKDGKVVKYSAKKGKNVLKEIIESDELASFLGEVALVDYDSPISNTNKVFETTLIDENASCHLALGSAFLDCVKNGNKLSKKEIDALGLNLSKNHVDFMIGTKDLEIVAETPNGEVTIMKNGNLVL